jgi:hypothetical protein
MGKREPGNGRDDARLHFTTGDQVTQSGFHEQTMIWLLRIWKQGAEGK